MVADREEMKMVVNNLVSDAVRKNDQGGIYGKDSVYR